MEYLSAAQREAYRENGYLVLEGHLPPETVARGRDEIARLSEHARRIDASDERIDLEDHHTRSQPRIRRIKRPDLQSDFFDELMRGDLILGPVRDLIGPNLRLHTAKLNMKKAEYGAPVQWHQDFAFYPHTNDDVLAVGIVFDDMTLENGPLQVIPGSHKGPVLDHHLNGVFAGACNLAEAGYAPEDAVALAGPAGTVSLHHARLLHGSALNRSKRDRQMLFYEMVAADAFPIMGGMTAFDSIEDFDARLLCGEATRQPRLVPVPVRIPQPQPKKAGSIYEIQSQGKAKDFQTYDETKAAT
ncbi:MAG: phytanoyl-CoA dioxygenase family protein [Kiloniellales bacterium]|nr:phytanoyl-CoA dioxygenase family protein [Kiloniellales bacterium]MDJ0972708.1 phytanoyl-CoA dioxygenase family protein [Kiloniellales bacterium]